MRTLIVAALLAAGCRGPALAQDAYVIGVTGGDDRPAGRHLRARRSRRCASISIVSTPPAASTARRSAHHAGRLGRAVEGRRQRQEAADAGQRRC